MLRFGLFVVAAIAVSCGGRVVGADVPKKQASKTRSIPFDLVGQGWIRMGAQVSGGKNHAETIRMMFDTGGGITLFSKSLCDRVGCVPEGTFTAKRMSGQELVLPMARVASIEIGGHQVTNVRVAVLASTEFLPPELGIDAAGALDLFRDQPFTIDYQAGRFVIENEHSLAARRAAGESVQVRVENDDTNS